MASVTIRRLSDELLARIKASADAHGRSLEQELRTTLAARYPTRHQVLGAIRERWAHQAEIAASDVDGWLDEGRR